MALHSGKQIISSICISLIDLSRLNWFNLHYSGITMKITRLSACWVGYLRFVLLVCNENYSYVTIYDYYHRYHGLWCLICITITLWFDLCLVVIVVVVLMLLSYKQINKIRNVSYFNGMWFMFVLLMLMLMIIMHFVITNMYFLRFRFVAFFILLWTTKPGTWASLKKPSLMIIKSSHRIMSDKTKIK